MQQQLGKRNPGVIHHIIGSGNMALCGQRVDIVLTVEQSYLVPEFKVCRECKEAQVFQRVEDLVAKYPPALPDQDVDPAKAYLERLKNRDFSICETVFLDGRDGSGKSFGSQEDESVLRGDDGFL